MGAFSPGRSFNARMHVGPPRTGIWQHMAGRVPCSQASSVPPRTCPRPFPVQKRLAREAKELERLEKQAAKVGRAKLLQTCFNGA